MTNKFTTNFITVYIMSLCVIYTATCFDIFTSSSGSLQSMTCYVTYFFKWQTLKIKFYETVRMLKYCFLP